MSKNQDILLEISQNIISTLDYQKVLQIISDGMSEILEIETAAIYLNENKDELYLGATTPPLDPNMPEEFRRIQMSDHPHIQKTITLKEHQILPDTRIVRLSDAEKSVVEFRKLRSLLYFPFIQKDEVLGVLILGTSNKTRNFTSDEINLGQTIANQLSIGIQNARLHYNLQLKNEILEEEIQERISVELALRNSEAHLSNALRIAKLGHWEYDIRLNQFIFSDEFYEIYHTTADNMEGYKMSDQEYIKKFVHPEDQGLVGNEIKKAIETKDKNFSNELEHKFIYSNRDTGYLTVRYKIQKDSKGNTIKIYGVNQDITDRKKTEKELKNHRDNLAQLVKEKTVELDHVIEELKSTNDELSHKNKLINDQNNKLKKTLKELKETQSRLIQAEKMASLGILTAGVAHEINNPLNYIMGSYLALETYFEETECKEPELIETLMSRLKTGIEKVTDIVKGLNQFSRENKNMDENCDIHAIIDNCTTMLGNQIKNRIDIIKRYDSNNLTIKGNVGQLHQVFMNILVNSIQATDNNGLIQISTSLKNEVININIKDNGHGISKNNILKVTDPFFTTKDPGKGTGLGLSITYSIIKEHGGSMEIESEVGNGTNIKISIPKTK